MQESAIISSLVHDIRDSHEECNGSLRVAVQAYWRCGKLLDKAKGEVRPGDYELWVEANFDFSLATARRYVAFYRSHVSGPLPGLERLTLGDGRNRQEIEGDVQFGARSTGFLGVVNRFDREWTRWEESETKDEDAAREVFRPVWDRLQKLFA